MYVSPPFRYCTPAARPSASTSMRVTCASVTTRSCPFARRAESSTRPSSSSPRRGNRRGCRSRGRGRRCALDRAREFTAAGPGNGCQSSRRAGAGHELRELRAAQRRHRIRALARAFEDVPARIDGAFDVAGLARHADRVLDLVVVRLELLEAERPVLDRRAARDAAGAVAARRLADDFEVPRIQAASSAPNNAASCRRRRSSSRAAARADCRAQRRSADGRASRGSHFCAACGQPR